MPGETTHGGGARGGGIEAKHGFEMQVDKARTSSALAILGLQAVGACGSGKRMHTTATESEAQTEIHHQPAIPLRTNAIDFAESEGSGSILAV